jgi:nicotinamide mononucleotide transporter PnuC
LTNDDSLQIQPRRLSKRLTPVLIISVVLLSLLVGWLLQRYTDDPQPYLDAFTTVPAIVAQILMVLAFREQWYIWMLVDVLALIMWLRAGNYCMAAQYFFWCATRFYRHMRFRVLLQIFYMLFSTRIVFYCRQIRSLLRRIFYRNRAHPY